MLGLGERVRDPHTRGETVRTVAAAWEGSKNRRTRIRQNRTGNDLARDLAGLVVLDFDQLESKRSHTRVFEGWGWRGKKN